MELLDLEKYLIGTKRHPAYKKTVEIYEELKVHADGEYPKDAIEERRPSETEKIKRYRKKIFVPLAKETMSQVFNCISKIRRSSDWVIKFEPSPI